MEANRPYDRPGPNTDSSLGAAPPPPDCLLPNYCNCQSRQRMLSRKKLLSSLWSAAKMASQTSGLRFTFSRLYNRVSKKMSGFFPPPWSLVGLYSLIGESWRRAVFQHKLSIASKQKRGFLSARLSVFCHGAEEAALLPFCLCKRRTDDTASSGSNSVEMYGFLTTYHFT